MKKIRFALFSVLLAVLVACNRAPSAPTLKAEVTCYLDGLDSTTKCTTGATSPGDPHAQSGSLQCGLNGKGPTIQWTFLKSHDGKDVYRFSRRPEGDSTARIAQAKEIQFAGQRVVVFDDTSQIVVIQTPKR